MTRMRSVLKLVGGSNGQRLVRTSRSINESALRPGNLAAKWVSLVIRGLRGVWR